MSAASNSEKPARNVDTRLFIAWAVSVIATGEAFILVRLSSFCHVIYVGSSAFLCTR